MTVTGSHRNGETPTPPPAGRIGRLVAIGGGHGLAVTLRAAVDIAEHITAVVSVADNGGSSGHLRDAIGVPPPGDLRRCLSALADPCSALGQALEHRFTRGDLDGHAVGNVVLAGLAQTTGDFVAACDELGRLVGARGRVLPASATGITLEAVTPAAVLQGQTAVQNGGGVRTVTLDPADPPVPPAVVDAIGAADQVVLGPGSLYTSVLAAATVPGIRAALNATAAQRVYVCNLGPQVPESEGHDATDHLRALQRHDVPVDVVLCHPGSALGCPDAAEVAPVRVVGRPVAGPRGLAHDPAKLAPALVACYQAGAEPGDLFG